jgi:hypothetical protein
VTVLAALALHDGQVVSTGRLVDVVWGVGPGRAGGHGCRHKCGPRRGRSHGENLFQFHGFPFPVGFMAEAVTAAYPAPRPIDDLARTR